MQEGLAAFGAAFGLVLLAEMGDRTQLALVALASRGRPLRILAGAAAAFAILTLVAVAVGGAVARYVAQGWLLVASGLVFLVLGALALRQAQGEEREEEDGTPAATARAWAGAGASFLLVLAAEVGDKTQVATAALAAGSGQPVATGLGAWLRSPSTRPSRSGLGRSWPGASRDGCWSASSPASCLRRAPSSSCGERGRSWRPEPRARATTARCARNSPGSRRTGGPAASRVSRRP
jgi:Ca2+/H+ antiporter, TMEM165/GDT1 family